MASGLYSHPGVPLEEHTNRALGLARLLMKEGELSWWTDSTRRAFLEMAIALHDFGKATDFFQAALRRERHKDVLSHHAHLSAFFFLHRAEDWGRSRGMELPWLALLFAYLAVRHHHTDLSSVYADLHAPDEEERAVLEDQIRHIPPEKANAFLEALDLSADVRAGLVFDPDAFLAWLENESPKLFRSWRQRWRRRKGDRADAAAFFHFLTGFSALLDADKLDAGAKGHLPARLVIPPDAVARYKRHAFSDASAQGLNRLREQACREVLGQPLFPKEHLYTLTLPTGMGKTLTGMAVALKLRSTVTDATGRMPRIIYALPFLSIIDQNAERLENVLAIALGQVDSRALIKHHHLADFRYRERDGEGVQEWDYTTSRLLTEGWHSEIVVTTFVQLFDTLLSWRNTSARRTNKLAGAILLLDEVQALPSVYWPLVRNLLNKVAEVLGTYVILMTATQPYLLNNARELVPEPELYFRALDRMDVAVNLTPITLEDFVAGLELEPDKSYLFMANTIASAQRLHALLKETQDESIVFLSTGVTPKERLERISALGKGRYRFAVSTQLIEAGVDVDFDVIYRDFAPLDALVQAAGRCNRNLTSGKRGEFHVVSWVDKKGLPFARWIYDPVLLDRTRGRLEPFTRLPEPDFLGLLPAYFQDVWRMGISDKVAGELWDAVCTLRFDGERHKPCVRRSEDARGAFISQFCLIEAQPYKRDVFVQVDDDAVAVWEEAKTILWNLRRADDLWEARELFAQLKPRFAQYVVSVALKPDTAPPWDGDLNIFVVPQEKLQYFYDSETGFRADVLASAWFL